MVFPFCLFTVALLSARVAAITTSLTRWYCVSLAVVQLWKSQTGNKVNLKLLSRKTTSVYLQSQNTAPPLITSFTSPVFHEQHAGPFLATHRSCEWGPCCPSPLSGGRRHAWTHQPRIRLLLLGRSQGPHRSSWLQRVTSVCVREDEKRYERQSADCDQRGPRCTLRTTPCCLSRRGSHAALTKQPWTRAEMCQRASRQRCTGQESSGTDRWINGRWTGTRKGKIMG